MSSPKEPFFFCTDLHQESDHFHGRRVFFPLRTEPEYIGLFDQVRKESVIGEASPVYLFSRTALAAIRALNPGAKILAILRQPLDFIVSWHKETLLAGYEDRADLFAVLKQERQVKDGVGVDLPRRAPCPRWVLYREWIRYHDHLERCFQQFPRDQVKVLIFEEFRQDNAGTFRQVAEWLGIDSTFQPAFRDVNKYAEGQLSPLARYVYHPRLRAAVRRLLPLRWHDPVWQFARRFSWRESSTPKTDKAKVREILHDEITETIERTSEILGRDLYEVWGNADASDRRMSVSDESETQH